MMKTPTTPGTANGPTRIRLALLYVVICLIWGTTWYAMKSAVSTIPHQ